ncbi:M3 family metallopeptidase [Flavobacterium soyangense]|uniref:Zn-dependent oligopeptidase n=1 Tax=Flavobacterium soyangense TaxID=2023265 RepID=A0A930UBF4_9FLAO|nr:M3 family metallopeptidase [Flavobacterium soyangense]MBF2708980.1 Zn-dependent oligopeptidase [Flavobacterium soyangense]
MKKLFILTLFAIGGIIQAQNIQSNILLRHDNKPIDFPKVNAATLKEAVAIVIKSSDEKVKKIVEAQPQTISNILVAYDDLQYEINDLSMKIGLISSTYANEAIRNAAYEEDEKLSVYGSALGLNEPLYKAIKRFYSTNGSTLSKVQKKFLSEEIISFEKNGMKLSTVDRKPLEALNKKLIELGNAFDKNIAESKDSLVFNEIDVKGIDVETLNSWKRPNGKYVVYVNGPNRIKIGENADNSKTRKDFGLRYNNRAYPQNITVLDSLLYYRNVYANKLGFTSYAAYALADKMAAKPENVWTFENDLIKKLSPLVTDEVKTLKAFKNEVNPTESDTLYGWDFSYYSKKMLNTKYQLNKDKVKEYFEMNNTINGMFKVYETLLGIQIKPVTNMPVWDSKVKTFEIWSEGKKAGSFYLDLFPRPNKYTHFACFAISQYSKKGNVETLPVAALICNFPEGTANEPSLLPHEDVITMFHEFGHLVHRLLCHPAIASQSSSAVKRDFIEAPSQFLENWCWEYDALKIFAKHYKTGETLPKELFDKMKLTQLVNIGSQYISQVGFGLIDFAYEDKYEETKQKGTLQIFKEKMSLNQLPFNENNHMICSFGHLNGYGANYYGYLWSKVYAEDMFSIFKKNGVMDTATGIRYKKEILEKGGTVPETEMVEKFLGRKSNSDAFLESLGIKN